MSWRMRSAAAALGLAGLAGAAMPAAAQSVTAAFQDFSGHSKAPVHIAADRLDVRQNDQAAVFSGNVVVVQGKSTLRTKQLTIYYYNTDAPDHTKSSTETRSPGSNAAKKAADNQAKPAPAASHPKNPPGQLPTSSRDIRKLIAVGNVVVTSADQRATGNNGVFDMASNTVTLTGNVVLTQGENVLHGNRLVVDLTTQHSRLESPGSGGRVEGVFVPNQQPGTAPAATSGHRRSGGHAKP